MKLYSTRLASLWLEAAALPLSKTRESRLTRREYTPPVMIDFQTLRASLAYVSIISPSESTRGLNGLSEGGC